MLTSNLLNVSPQASHNTGMTISFNWKSLRTINHVLSVLVVLLAAYIVLSPLLPRLMGGAQSSEKVSAVTARLSKEPISSEPTLKIPRLDMKQQIHTGLTTADLNKGVWLVPKTSTPDKQSNTVIVGHRFTYAGPAVFYFLDKVQLRDKLYVDWQNKRYIYEVENIKEVPPTELSVHAPTPKPTLTLYTCTPLLTAKNRLVITAKLMEVKP
jgi:LPXTG-site transpeptidase (sortase) family protein